jgi:glycerol-3-phosphate O-acyltransferase
MIRRRFERDLARFLKTPDLYAQSFKFTNRLVVRQQLLADAEINAKILEFAKRESLPVDAVQRRVETYVEEILPHFNLLSYYKIGYSIARMFIHLVYDPLVDVEKKRVLEHLPQKASPVYVMNHRSNVDFVLLAYILAGKVSVSYAVGEWARIWPLEHLFKSFGSYFVRRGFKEDLYHKVLERYVQLTARHGVAQAIFPEGMITRDGRLLPPKLGLLQFLSGTEADPTFERELTFIPVGVNYDWVLEDYNLVAESEGRVEKTGFWKKVQVIITGPFVGIGLLVVNGVRFLAGRLKLHGYASVSFGEPVSLRRWSAERGIDLRELDYEARKPVIKEFGAHLIGRIGAAIPATPVTLVAVSILDSGRTKFSLEELVDLARTTRDELAKKQVRVVTGREFEKFRHALVALKERAAHREGPDELDEVERAIVASEETETLVKFAVDVLRRNRILRRGDRTHFELRGDRINYLRYYANSLAHHLGRSYLIPGTRVAAGEDSQAVRQLATPPPPA